ncbi:hypothetical protein XU18_3102 [Perkinsela sp. CCAP 1560/4]|nr:hypothetical protein XU18_3102 [Perkinsela sp. CCAP 1560/4]|eukprot:KNH05940.1 hypothetical protein XU18_3102 [Perkinsela sp. CCAP 1560/4]
MRRKDISGDADEQTHKKFHKQTKGKGAEKSALKKKRKLGLDTEPNRHRNPKAFTRPSDGTRKIAVRKRNIEQSESRARVPKVNKSLVPSSQLQPPTLIAIVGPEGCGKSTFIRSFVKACVCKNLSRVYGPVTFTNGNPQRPKRYTFIECPPTLTAMVDVSKVAEVVVMVFDASVGFETSSFEFLTLANVHGLPHVFGLLTHLDCLKNNKALKKTKKKMRHRFSQEVASGAGKLFYLTGLEPKSGLYKRKEMLLLGHYLATIKTEPTSWRQAHSHLLLDRFQDVTPQKADTKADMRQIQCYGYIRGKPLEPNTRVHMPGVGDFSISAIDILRDPCGATGANEGSDLSKPLSAKSKALRRSIYAPMCDLGELSYDPGGEVFVHSINPSHYANADVQADSSDHIGAQMLKDLRRLGYDEESVQLMPSHTESTMAITPKAQPSYETVRPVKALEAVELLGNAQFRCAARADSTLASSGTVNQYFADGTFESLRNRFVTGNVFKSLIGEKPELESEHCDDKGYESVESESSDAPRAAKSDQSGEALDESARALVDFFATHTDDISVRGESAAPAEGKPNSSQEPSLPPGVSADYFAKKQAQRRALFEGKPTTAHSPEETDSRPRKADDIPTDDLSTERKKFTNIFEEQQSRLQSAVDEMALHSASDLSAMLGYFPGIYARVTISEVPGEFVDAFTNSQGFSECDLSKSHFPPLILGGLLANETSTGLINTRVRKHRWQVAQAIRSRKRSEERQTTSIRSSDPYILSAGWRRFETRPVFAVEENGPTNRRRYMKYLPEHNHCIGVYHGPWIAPNCGVCGFRVNRQSADTPHAGERRAQKNFRILFTGYTMEVNAEDSESSTISKKLKLVGYPDEIARNTVFVKDMFNSAEEASRFEGAKLRTVAGIRGAIKKALPKKNGIVRCTFEDKILKSDIVYCRVYTKMPIPKYCNPVTNLLLAGPSGGSTQPPHPELGRWAGIRSRAELLRASGKPFHPAENPAPDDAHYAASLGAKRKSTKALLHSELRFRMPTSLARAAPFTERVQIAGSRPAHQPAIGVPRDLKKDLNELTAVYLDEKESRHAAVEKHFTHIKTRMENADAIAASIKKEKLAKKNVEMEERKQRMMKKFKKEHSKLAEFQKLKKIRT